MNNAAACIIIVDCFIIDRMAIIFAYCAYGRPARMSRNRIILTGKTGQKVKNRIFSYLSADIINIIAQAADLGGYFISNYYGNSTLFSVISTFTDTDTSVNKDIIFGTFLKLLH